jgi:cytoskeleton protein RodZ
LQAFENDQFEQGAHVHIGRAMVASVARFLGLNAQALLAQLPQPVPPGPAPGTREAVGGFGEENQLTMRRDDQGPVSPIWWIALVLLLLAGLVYGYPRLAQFTQYVPVAVPQELVKPAGSASKGGLDDAATQAAPIPLPGVSAPELAAVPDRGASALKIAQAVLQFKARGSTWIEVTDGTGTVLLRRTLAASETAEVGGNLPLAVVVGRADHTEVLVRGTTFSLESYTQDNVARFKVP